MNYQEAISLLRQMISIPSVSREEKNVADMLHNYMLNMELPVERLHNNLWVKGTHFTRGRKTLLLNSHIDTVKPTDAYTRNPFSADIENGNLYGLGSNDAGASGVSLFAAFSRVKDIDLGYNLIFSLTAEEEVMGEKGMRAFLREMERQGIDIDMAIVGEPTGLDAAIGERGLVVLDCIARGPQGHAARHTGDTSILMAMRDINRIKDFKFIKSSPLLGDIKATVTQIEAGRQHNVVPETCKFVVDIRTTDAYTNEEVVTIMQSLLESEAKERSTRVRASALDARHPLVETAVSLGAKTFVSPTTSDMALMPFPSLKLGVGESRRSHSADEYVMLEEIEKGVDFYTEFLKKLKI